MPGAQHAQHSTYQLTHPLTLILHHSLIADRQPQNLIAQSQSGTGKTAAFTLGMLAAVDPTVPGCQAICVCPTRELARQNLEVSVTGKRSLWLCVTVHTRAVEMRRFAVTGMDTSIFYRWGS